MVRDPEMTAISANVVLSYLSEAGSVNSWRWNWYESHMDGADEVAVLGAVANSPHLYLTN